MGGVGKWVKKNPLATAAILGMATGGFGLLAAAPAAAGGLAAAGAAGGAAAGAAGGAAAGGAAAAGAAGGAGLLAAPAAAGGLAAAGAAGGAAPLGLGTASLFGSGSGLGAGLLSGAAPGAMGSSILAPAAASGGLGGGFAGLAGAASPIAAEAAMSVPPPTVWGRFSAGMDKVEPYMKLYGQAQGMLGPQEQPQAPQIQPPQLRGPSASLNPIQMYGGGGSGLYGMDPEEERRRMMALWAQQQGVM